MYKEFPSHPHGTASRRRRGTFLENSVFGFTYRENYSPWARGMSLLRYLGVQDQVEAAEGLC